MKEKPDYYAGAVRGYMDEVKSLSEAFKDFMPGRTWQFLNLVEDYREAFALAEAAPELLEVCKAAVEHFGADCYGKGVSRCKPTECGTAPNCWLLKAREIVAKAEGRE